MTPSRAAPAEYRRGRGRRAAYPTAVSVGRTALAALAAAAVVAAVPSKLAHERDVGAVQLAMWPGAIAVTNGDGTWTVRTRCRSGRGTTVGPGYVSGLVARDGTVVVDDVRAPGTLNDPEFGGLGAFAWHHARGRAGRLRLSGANAWEISGRICARDNGGFGVTGARHRVRRVGPAVEAAVDVLFSDRATYPRPLLRLRYRYRFERSVVRSWVDVEPRCPGGRCGRTGALAFVKEPKLVAHVRGGAFTRMSTLNGDGSLACIYVGGGAPTGPIYDTGQCAAERRSVLRFDYGSASSGDDGRCETRPCLNVVMRAATDGATHPWHGARHGLDGWAVAAARAPAAFVRDTASNDGVLWDCHADAPSDPDVRRWETTGRLDAAGRYISLGGLFPAWEGGRGGYDCEPLARVFPPAGARWRVFASYSLGPGWEALR